MHYHVHQPGIFWIYTHVYCNMNQPAVFWIYKSVLSCKPAWHILNLHKCINCRVNQPAVLWIDTSALPCKAACVFWIETWALPCKPAWHILYLHGTCALPCIKPACRVRYCRGSVESSLTPSLPQHVKFSGWKMHGRACKQCIFRSYNIYFQC